ncbi:chemotaxis protein CheW [Actinoplanes derwentensis]|uniref:Purine-binding chemotaxis protein CheW n=1 Tax=Actinoplanes derwentensis TaxID=113562 RepID=A0A1H1QHW0_9ACTN|nr:chemotaxis protein CheW [Actinoplanes derwentensis]GID82132.1 hypothetical protein Ade03nite_10560 [Actinoplanes derwentensis]SDS22974.1 purine-binding chemotaxis protein CheW [Actinoplanes derwentensis]
MAGQPGGVAQAVDAGVLALLFRAGPLYCALPLDEVVETMRPLATRPLAGPPPYVRGLTIVRGTPSPVIDVTRLLTGITGQIERYVAVQAGRGMIVCATGPVIGVQEVQVEPPEGPAALLTGAAKALIAGVGTIGTEPLILLRSIQAVPDEVWEAAGSPPEDGS